VLKHRLVQKNLSKKVIKESLVRLIYVEMLGHDASFGYVHAIQMTAAGDLMQKKVGYLCAALTLSPEHEFRFMLVNQLQRDLASANILEVCTALVALAKLITEEMVPALLPSVSKLLTHDQAMVRKKTVLALHRIYQLDPGALDHLIPTFRRVLCDKDPSVMGASLCLLHALAKADPSSQKDLVASYVSILKQIVEHRLPKDFDYHRIPAPWIQIKLLKILATLGTNDQSASEGMYEVLHECMRRANTGIYVGYAIIYESVRTITAIYPNDILLDAAADAIARFIQSESHNLKYLGVTGLAAIVRDHPRYAAEHQMIVLDCLEDPDETLKRKTLDLLFRMTNPVNAEVVVEKLLFFLQGAQDKFLRQDLVTRICQLAERFAPSNIWYVRTVAKVFELGGDLVESEVAHNLLRLLAEGGSEEEEGGEEDQDAAMRREACMIFFDMFEKSILPDILLRVMFWTLGEYSYLMGSECVPEVLEAICETASRQGMKSSTRGYAVSAVMKMCAQLGNLPSEAADLIDKYNASRDADLQQKCLEFLEIARNLQTLTTVLPVDASCEDLSDPDFSFLDNFVESERQRGAAEYSPPSKEENESYEYEDNSSSSPKAPVSEPTLKYDAYEKPQPISHFVKDATPIPPPAASLNYGAPAGFTPAAATNGTSHEAAAAPKPHGGLNLSGVKSVWGAQGYTGSGAQQQRQQPPPAPSQPAAVPTAYAREEYTIEAPRQDTPPPVVVKEEEPPKPKELTERERMAAALFGGTSAAVEQPKPARVRVRNKGPSAAQQRAATPPPEPEPVLDLLGFDEPAPAPAAVSAAPMDLLSLGDPTPPQTAAPQSSGLASPDLLLGSPVQQVGTSLSSPPFSGHSMNTQEFGQRWVSNVSEAKASLPLQAVNIQQVVSRIESVTGLSCVETITHTQEAIFAGLDSSGALVLVHGKKSQTGVDILIHAQNPNLANSAAGQITNILG